MIPTYNISVLLQLDSRYSCSITGLEALRCLNGVNCTSFYAYDRLHIVLPIALKVPQKYKRMSERVLI